MKKLLYHEKRPTAPTVRFPVYKKSQVSNFRYIIRRLVLRKQRKLVLELIVRDWEKEGDAIICGLCRRIHTTYMPNRGGVKLDQYAGTQMKMQLAKCDSEGLMPRFVPYTTKTYPLISISQIQMAMRLAQSHRPAMAMNSLRLLSAYRITSSQIRNQKHLWLTQPKIMGSELLLRTQHWFMFPIGYRAHFKFQIKNLYSAAEEFLVNSKQQQYHMGEIGGLPVYGPLIAPRKSGPTDEAPEFDLDSVICSHIKKQSVDHFSACARKLKKPSWGVCCQCGIQYELMAKEYYPGKSIPFITRFCSGAPSREVSLFASHFEISS